MVDQSLKDKLVLWAAQNAFKHNGKPVKGAVIGSLLNENSEYRKQLKDLQPHIDQALNTVSNMSADQIKETIAAHNPEFFEKKERNIFAFLNIEEGDKVVTAFPPGPEKYPHIGHAKALYLNYDLAQYYQGKFILRFEDTNPKLVKEEFYTIMQEDFAWLGVKWDEVVYASDYMDYYEECAIKLIKEGKAYIDKSSQEDIRQSRQDGTASPQRELSVDEQLKLWEEFKQAPEGTMVVRMKIDLQHKNSTMRDPTMYRIIDHPHARTGTKYRTWPSYDFQNAIMDGKTGVTHRLRSIEFEMRNELHNYIRKELGLAPTVTYEFGRFNMTGVESSGRVIREKIENGELTGWDDPSLTTIRALKKRGFQPEAIKQFVISTGITKNIATLTWDDLYRQNTKIMDEKAKRFFFVKDPVQIKVQNDREKVLAIALHPQTDLGTKNLEVDGNYYVPQQDMQALQDGDLVRLMHNGTIQKTGEEYTFIGEDLDTFKGKSNAKATIQYVPVQHAVNVKVIMPDKQEITGWGESNLAQLSQGECVQFERFGNVRFDHTDDNTYVFFFTN